MAYEVITLRFDAVNGCFHAEELNRFCNSFREWSSLQKVHCLIGQCFLSTKPCLNLRGTRQIISPMQANSVMGLAQRESGCFGDPSLCDCEQQVVVVGQLDGPNDKRLPMDKPKAIERRSLLQQNRSDPLILETFLILLLGSQDCYLFHFQPQNTIPGVHLRLAIYTRNSFCRVPHLFLFSLDNEPPSACFLASTASPDNR